MPNPNVQWLRLSCPSCRARCRVRKGAALASCLCPQCGHALLKPPKTSPPPGEKEETGQSSHVRAHEKLARGPVAIVTEEEVERELRKDDPQPPANPLWQGVYSCPWQPEHLRAWLLFGFGLCVMAFLATAVCHLTYRLQLSASYLEWDVYRMLSRYFVGALMGETVLDAKGVDALAKLPSLDQLRARIVGLIQAPATRVAGVIQAPAAQLARVFSAYGAKDAA